MLNVVENVCNSERFFVHLEVKKKILGSSKNRTCGLECWREGSKRILVVFDIIMKVISAEAKWKLSLKQF